MFSVLSFVAGVAVGRWGWSYVVQVKDKLFPKKAEETLPREQTWGE